MKTFNYDLAYFLNLNEKRSGAFWGARKCKLIINFVYVITELIQKFRSNLSSSDFSFFASVDQRQKNRRPTTMYSTVQSSNPRAP